MWSEILSQKGKEVYLKNASVYVKSPTGEASFESISTDAASERDEIVLGYVSQEGERVINPSGPARFETRTWAPGDLIVALADDGY